MGLESSNDHPADFESREACDNAGLVVFSFFAYFALMAVLQPLFMVKRYI